MPDKPQEIRSSYRENEYGSQFRSLTRLLRPRLVVELGVYMGYSAIHIARGLLDNAGVTSFLDLIDLWHAYPFNHCERQVAQKNLEQSGVLSAPHLEVRLFTADLFDAARGYGDGSVDLLHIDASNDGDFLQRALAIWGPKLAPGATLLLEGGSLERDNVEWMLRYHKQPIRSFLESHDFSSQFEHVTLQPFPSLTIARRRS